MRSNSKTLPSPAPTPTPLSFSDSPPPALQGRYQRRKRTDPREQFFGPGTPAERQQQRKNQLAAQHAVQQVIPRVGLTSIPVGTLPP